MRYSILYALWTAHGFERSQRTGRLLDIAVAELARSKRPLVVDDRKPPIPLPKGVWRYCAFCMTGFVATDDSRFCDADCAHSFDVTESGNREVGAREIGRE